MIKPTETQNSATALAATLKRGANHFTEKLVELLATGCDAYHFEQSVQKMINELGREVLSTTLSKWDIQADAVEYKGQRYNKVGYHLKEYQSVFGKVEVMRHIYRNRIVKDHKSICPFEIQTGMVNGYWTAKAAELATFTMTELPSERSAKVINQLTSMNVCSSSVDLLMKNVGEIWELNRQDFDLKLVKDFKVPQKAVSVAVSLDGVLIPTRCTRVLPSDSKYEEASCGTISFFNEDGEKISTIQYARSPEYKKTTLKSQLKQAMDIMLDQNPTLEVVKLADGSRDNWSFLEEQIPGDRNIIDFYHVSEHLKEGLDAYFGEKSLESSKMHVIYRRKLKNTKTGAKHVLSYLQSLSIQKPKNKKLAEQVTYFTRNWKKMPYAKTKAEHLPIGSGIVEAACKTLVTQRLKCSGMHWDYDGAQSVLALRAANQSNWFELAFELIRDNITCNVTPLRKISRGNYEPLVKQCEKIAA